MSFGERGHVLRHHACADWTHLDIEMLSMTSYVSCAFKHRSVYFAVGYEWASKCITTYTYTNLPTAPPRAAQLHLGGPSGRYRNPSWRLFLPFCFSRSEISTIHQPTNPSQLSQVFSLAQSKVALSCSLSLSLEYNPSKAINRTTFQGHTLPMLPRNMHRLACICGLRVELLTNTHC